MHVRTHTHTFFFHHAPEPSLLPTSYINRGASGVRRMVVARVREVQK